LGLRVQDPERTRLWVLGFQVYGCQEEARACGKSVSTELSEKRLQMDLQGLDFRIEGSGFEDLGVGSWVETLGYRFKFQGSGVEV
jgi:hypothetical protein